MLQKSRVPLVRSRITGEIQGVKGEAVVTYCEPLTTRQRRTGAGDAVLSAFPKGKQHGDLEGFARIHKW